MTDQSGNNADPASQTLPPRISVIGVGGAGGNAINNMISANLEGVEFVVANTDAQALAQSLCTDQIQLGANLTKGLGAGSRPEIGHAAAAETIDAIVSALKGANMAFITAGMGGGTGTGAAPVIAQAAREQGVLTVGVVSKPFEFEGARRMRQAEAGIAELTKYVDTLIVIPNQNLFRIADEKTTFADAFKLADEVLHSGVRGVTDLMVMPGLVNLDFADVRAVMAGMGKAVMGTGEAEGDGRALAAAQAAISNPLLDDISMKGARSVLINITGGLDLMLMEVDEAANRIREEVDPDANIIFGSAFSEALDGKIRVSVIATGNDLENAERLTPKSNSPFVNNLADSPDTKSAASTSTAGAVGPRAGLEEKITVYEKNSAAEIAGGMSDAANHVVVEASTGESPNLRLVGSTPDLSGLERLNQSGENSSGAAPRSDSTDVSTRDQELTIPPQPTKARPSLVSPNWETKPLFNRPARPVKSESTLEAFKNNQTPEEAPDSAPDEMHYVVWEVDLGARIYKVPSSKLASIGSQPHADRLKLFDNLEKAKAEANAIFKRIADERTAMGLTRSILEPTLADLLGWDEDKVPQYFL